MQLFEFADAKASLVLWEIFNDCVWKAISDQAQEQALQKKEAKSAPKTKLPPRITIAHPQLSIQNQTISI